MSNNTTTHQGVKYSAQAHFYNIRDGIDVTQCRRSSYIISENHIGSTLDSNHDALVVMMNPGSSKPLDANHIIKEYTPETICNLHLDEELCPAKIDATMHSIKRLMHLQNWCKVKIINLSDYRTPQSNDFCDFLEMNERIPHYITHSKREHELTNEIKLSASKTIIFAWGVDNKFDAYTAGFLKLFKRGIGVTNTYGRFIHPMGTRPPQLWVTRMNELLSNQ
tara:strand:- start:1152 stop:1817 length:666 start_codon:yes stop_codon:yes gene_type:complete